MHPPDKDGGQKILVPTDKLRNAIQSSPAWINGFSPGRRKPKRCRISANTEGIGVGIHTDTVEWWMVVTQVGFEQALG